MLAVFLIFGLSGAAEARVKTATPRPIDVRKGGETGGFDFAYPQTTFEKASRQLPAQLRSGDYNGALSSAIAMTIAKNSISKSNAGRQIALLDSLKGVLPSPYNSIAALIEATLYTEIYQNGSMKYNSRTEPELVVAIDSEETTEEKSEDSGGEPDFLQWDFNGFRKKIFELTEFAVAGCESTKTMPVTQFSPVISYSEVANSLLNIDSGFTIYDFVINKTIDLRNNFERRQRQIPFFKNSEEGTEGNADALYDRLITFHKEPCDALAYAILGKFNSMEEPKADFLWNYIEKLNDFPCVVPLFKTFSDRFNPTKTETPVDFDDYYGMLLRISKLDLYGGKKNAIENLLSSLHQQKVLLKWESVCLTKEPINIKYTYTNSEEFNILIFQPKNPERGNSSTKIGELTKYFELVKDIPIKTKGNSPLEETDSVAVSLESPGYYAVIVSKTSRIKDVIANNEQQYVDFIHVSDIDLVAYNDETSGASGVFVVDAVDSRPLSGADVSFRYGYPPKKVNGKTDREGFASFNQSSSATARGNYRGSEAEEYVNNYLHSNERGHQGSVILFTDLSLYKPGDTVRLSGVAYSESGNVGRIEADYSTTLTVRNPFYEEVQTLKVTSDENGRFSTEFKLKDNCQTGSWTVSQDNNHYGFANFQVAEYKAPTFFITLERKNTDQTDCTEFEGKVSTYSGLPLGGIDVDYEISYRSRRPWLNVPATSYGNKTTTDKEGKFTIVLPLENIKSSDYRYGFFTLSATAVSEAGETAFSNPVSFGLSDSEELSVRLSRINNVDDGKLHVEVAVNNLLGYPVKGLVAYQIYKGEEKTPLLNGELETPFNSIDVSRLASGEYCLVLSSPDERFLSQKESFIIYRTTDEVPPMATPLWIPQKEYIVESGKKETEVHFGSSYKGQNILCVTVNSSGKVTRQWLKSNGKNETIKIGSPKNDERTFVKFITVRDHKTFEKQVVLIPQPQMETVEVATKTFRDRITPGETERWEFKVTLGGKEISTPAMAVMSNKALDAITPFNWPVSIFQPYYRDFVNLHGSSPSFTSDLFTINYQSLPVFFPSPMMWINTYGMPLYSNYYDGGMVMRKSRATKASPQASGQILEMNAMAMDTTADLKMEASVAYTGGMAEAGDEESPAPVADAEPAEEIREIELPLAFFKPDLMSDREGNLDIDFTVPDFNTEWKLQIFVYTPELKSTCRQFTTIASKKVMVQMVAPRFLRTGDDVELRATLFNNSEETLPIGGRYEIFDIMTGEILQSQSFQPEEVEASGNRTILLSYHCPDNLSSIGIRAFAFSGDTSDGEQALIPVLPSSQPVVESTPFYLQPKEREFTLVLPKFKETDKITLNYTDNPMWSVLTALPSLKENDSETLLQNLSDFYANCVGYGLIKDNPNLKKGLREIIEGEDKDSLLVSNLYKNADLKTVELSSTPWVNDARNEAMRLSKLGDLLNEEKAESAIYGSWLSISRLQNPDGGWCWYKGAESSRWMTETLLLNFAMLNRAGFMEPSGNEKLKEEILKALNRGFSFCEKEINREIARYKNPENYPYASLKNYILAGSLLPEIKKSEGYLRLQKKVVSALLANWKNEDIYDKATTAMLLHRVGRESDALSIMESLRQFASFEPSKGMWYDNLSSSYYGAGKLLTTARVLQAFVDTEPDHEAVDRLRQWLLIQRQAQDWDEGLFSVEVINAMLTSGSKWADKFELPQISIGNYVVPDDRIGLLTGNINISLTADVVSGETLTIKRDSPGPAWGGIVSQFIAPMESVKSASIPDLKIEKEYRIISPDSEGAKAERGTTFKLGDKVRVTMIITCDRDLDYVALTDERAACLEPEDQLSGYRRSDNIGFYREVRNSATNMYFSFLPKGTHIITYDCRVSEAGEFASGVATLQSQYAPLITAHSKGAILKVEEY